MRCLERAMKRRTGFSSVTTSHNSEARERFFFTMVMVEGMFRALVARHEFISPLFQALFFWFIALFFSFFFFLLFSGLIAHLSSLGAFSCAFGSVLDPIYTVWTSFGGGAARPPPHPQRRQEGHRQQVRIEV